jgi:hypothetical protein
MFGQVVWLRWAGVRLPLWTAVLLLYCVLREVWVTGVWYLVEPEGSVCQNRSGGVRQVARKVVCRRQTAAVSNAYPGSCGQLYL